MPTRFEQYERAKKVLPGGVNSSTRYNRALQTPFYASRAEAGYVWDIEGRKFIDMCCAHGAALLGHAHPAINEAVQKRLPDVDFLYFADSANAPYGVRDADDVFSLTKQAVSHLLSSGPS